MAYLKFDQSQRWRSLNIKSAVASTKKALQVAIGSTAALLLTVLVIPFLVLAAAAMMFGERYPGTDED